VTAPMLDEHERALDYLYGLLDGEDKARFEAHLAGCDGCTTYLSQTQQVIAQLRTEVGAMATGLAGRIVGESLEDEARQRRTVERFIAELESAPAPATS